jgi:hypothetical protein
VRGEFFPQHNTHTSAILAEAVEEGSPVRMEAIVGAHIVDPVQLEGRNGATDAEIGMEERVEGGGDRGAWMR